MTARRFVLLFLVASSACLPASGMSPAQGAIQNPGPELAGADLSAPSVARDAPARSTNSQVPGAPSASGKKPLWPWLLVVGAAVVLLILSLPPSGT